MNQSPDSALLPAWRRFSGAATRPIAWLVSGRWEWRVALAGFALTLLLHPPVLGHNAGGNWDYIGMQAHSLLDPPLALEGSHESKLAFRLVPPLVARTGIGFGFWLAVQAMLGILVFKLVARIAELHLRSRKVALVVVLAVAASYLGGQYVFDDHAYFDTVAVAGLVGALSVRSSYFQALCLLVAMWTDERAVIATAAVITYAMIVKDRRRVAVAVVVAGSYIAGRAALGARYGLSTPAGPDWVAMARDELDVSLPALWMALKGLWLFPVAGIIVLATRGRRLAAASLAGAVGISGLAALAVLDVTRSAAYLLPAVLCGVAAVATEPRPATRRLSVGTLAVSLLVPTFFVIAPDWNWILPLPLQLLPN